MWFSPSAPMRWIFPVLSETTQQPLEGLQLEFCFSEANVQRSGQNRKTSVHGGRGAGTFLFILFRNADVCQMVVRSTKLVHTEILHQLQ